MKHFRTRFPALCLALLYLASSGPARAAQKNKEKVVWDYWYTVSVKSLPAEMYNDKFTLHGDKVQLLEHVWKKEEGYINEEQLGEFAIADMALTPLFFNYRETYRTTETIIDGNVHDGRTLVVNVRKAGQPLPAVNHSISSGTFFEGFFPLWLGRQIKRLQPTQSASFSTILEDDIENGFESQSGTVRLEKPDDFAKRTDTKKLSVDFHDKRTYWWVDSRGATVRTESPQTGAVIERVSKEKAQSFLK